MSTEHRLTISKTARYYQLGEVSLETREVWLCCHGYGQLAEPFVQRLEPIASDQRVIVAPEALHRFYLDPPDRSAADRRVGATWMTREDRETDIQDYIEYLDQVCALVCPDPALGSSLVGFGFSQGTATIARWAAATRHPVSRLILWGSGLPPDLDWSRAAQRFQQAPVTIVAGEQDEFALPDRIAEQESLLAQHGVRYSTVRFRGGHQLDDLTLKELAREADAS
ncbi:MAG: phospholipase [Gemmatimonadota bacterium]